MSDRHVAYTVVLSCELKDEDSQRTLAAIRMLKGVLSVVPVVADANFYVARQQAKYELRRLLFDALREDVT